MVVITVVVVIAFEFEIVVLVDAKGACGNTTDIAIATVVVIVCAATGCVGVRVEDLLLVAKPVHAFFVHVVSCILCVVCCVLTR